MSNSAQVSAKASSLVIRSAIVAAVGGLIFGFDTAVISGANAALKKQFHLDDGGLGATVAIATVGTIIGALIGGRSADRFGRRKLLFFIGILYVLGALGTALAPSHLVLMIFRFIGGIGVGLSSVCAPIYTAEIAPARVRGRLVGLVQFNIVLGILVAYLSNYIIDLIVHDQEIAWRWMLGVMVVPSVLFLVFLMTVPETPRWLMAKGHEEKAIAISRRLCNTVEESDEQIQEIRDQLASAGSQATLSQFFTRRYFKVIALAFFIAMFNQLSGINAILYYAPEVMKQAGADDNAALLMSVAVGLMNLIATMAALTVIDRIGRRSLMIVGSIGYLVSMGFLTAVMFMFQGHFNSTSSTLVLVGLLVFIAAHAFGQGSVIWVFISEIFPTRVRGLGQSLGSLTHWVFAAITTYAFPPIIGAWGGGWAFSIFLVCMFGQLVWVLTKMPETKGIPLEEMEDKLGLNK
ncbi:sugar porter family MFS transporter [Arachnia propionica]|jgi:MFS transporter, SP family|uniref:D-xylose transporter n=1 Tax=Arachnia propionica TaxID=1750 RepID=A0A3N4CZR2_9ACTN|nr:sugar porter family MFS transporter [Arachnia propionica]AFN46738.1 MFS transporter, SP family [Arachnia propionica F0230a]QCT38643.1 sugar porter family MFS transporter [Arachnia propionica]QUC11753.1 sugar porter family MFS transporter [Arachnia propionica]QUC13558.1 sugar porter family MFS transporter [Arachnia propionica]RPA18578.1 sugar porter family MFS transporter [Arachnia propionica]